MKELTYQTDIDTKQPNLVVAKNDRLLAVGAHASSVFFPIFGPLVALLLSKSSLYGRYHSWRALIGDLKLIALTLFIAAISLGHTIFTAFQTYQSGIENANFWQILTNILIKGIAIWLIIGAFQLVNTISSIAEAIKTLQSDHWLVRNNTDRLSAKISRLSSSLTRNALKR